MKKIFAMAAIAAAALFAGNVANAQLGINVGYAPQTYNTELTVGSLSVKDTLKMNGFFAGVNYNTKITGDLNVSVGLQVRYNTKKDESTIATVTTTKTNTQMLVDVPILFNYGLSLTDDLKISLFLGPTVSYALSGNSKEENSVLGTLIDYDWYGDDGDKKALDVSGTVGVNLTFSDYRLYAGYNMGLLNLNQNDNTTTKGSNIFVGLGLNL